MCLKGSVDGNVLSCCGLNPVAAGDENTVFEYRSWGRGVFLWKFLVLLEICVISTSSNSEFIFSSKRMLLSLRAQGFIFQKKPFSVRDRLVKDIKNK